MTTNPRPTLYWEVRYNSDIAGRALYDTYTSEPAALAASRFLARSFAVNGLRPIAATVTVSLVNYQRPSSSSHG